MVFNGHIMQSAPSREADLETSNMFGDPMVIHVLQNPLVPLALKSSQ